MQSYTGAERYSVKQRHTCTHCGVNEALQDQQWCLKCVQQFEQWLQQDYCDGCLKVTVAEGETYCDNCTDQLCLELAQRYEDIMAAEGLY